MSTNVVAASVKRILDEAMAKAEAEVAREMRGQLNQFKLRHFPKRRLRFMDAMGQVIIWLDDEPVDDLVHRLGNRCPETIRELDQLRLWYVDVTSNPNFCIADIEV